MPFRQSRHRAADMLDSIGDAVLSTDLTGRVTYLNRVAEIMTGWSRVAAQGRALEEVFHIVDHKTRDVARNPMALAVQLNKPVGLPPNCVLIRRDGHETAIEDSAAPIHDRAGRVVGAVIVFRDVGVALETSRQMAHMAQHDTLTGLPNRLLLSDRLNEAVALARRRGKPLGVLFVDVDGFKGVNDAFGHAVGDQWLRTIGAGLSQSLRQSDTVSRYGGDEFVVLLSELERAEDVSIVARKLLRSVAEPRHPDTAPMVLTASIGISLYPDHGTDAGTLISNADAAMYEAKRAGCGDFRLFERRAGTPAPVVDRAPNSLPRRSV